MNYVLPSMYKSSNTASVIIIHKVGTLHHSNYNNKTMLDLTLYIQYIKRFSVYIQIIVHAYEYKRRYYCA